MVVEEEVKAEAEVVEVAVAVAVEEVARRTICDSI